MKRNQPNIGMLLDSKRGFPPDIRVEKEIKTLTHYGFNVFVLTYKVEPEQKEKEYINELECTVIRLKKRNQIIEKFRQILQALLVLDVYWKKNIINFIFDYDIDILHAHDLQMIQIAVKAAKKRKIDVIGDLHENMPAARIEYRKYYSGIKRIIYSIL